MALDNHPRPPREDQWRPVYVPEPEARPDLDAAIYLQRGRGPEMEIYSGVKKTSNASAALLSLWFLKTFARASVAAQHKTLAETKAAASVDPRW